MSVRRTPAIIKNQSSVVGSSGCKRGFSEIQAEQIEALRKRQSPSALLSHPQLPHNPLPQYPVPNFPYRPSLASLWPQSTETMPPITAPPSQLYPNNPQHLQALIHQHQQDWPHQIHTSSNVQYPLSQSSTCNSCMY
jgi:hypothetical protein